MAAIRTPSGFVDDNGNPLPMAQTDTPAAPFGGRGAVTPPPNVGGAVIANAPAASLTNPAGAAAQPPTAALSTGTNIVRPGPAPTPNPQAVSARPPTQRGPTSGVPAPTDDALIRAKADAQIQAEEGNQAVKSPTALVLDYLTKQGLPRTSENVRRALEANARDPSTIQGLVNQAPPAPTAVDTRPNSGGGGGGRALPTPPIPPSGGGDGGGAPSTSAGGLSASDLAKMVLLGAGGAGAAYLMSGRGRGGGGAGGGADIPITPADEAVAEYVGRGGVPNTGRTIDLPSTAITDTTPRRAITGPEATPPAEPPSATSSAIDKALKPSGGTITADDIVRSGATLPAGMSAQDVADAINGGGDSKPFFQRPRNAGTAADANAAAKATREAAAARDAARAARLFRRP